MAEKQFSDDELFAAARALAKDEHFRQLRTAQERQQYVQKFLGVERKSVDGLGAPVMEIDPVLFHTAAHLEADAAGKPQYDVWKDKTFQRRMREEGVIVPVRATGTHDIHVGYSAPMAVEWERQGAFATASTGTPSTPKFHKCYG